MKLLAKRGAPISSPLPHPSPATLGVVRLAWAATLLASPARVVKAFGSPVDRTSVTVARVLGARHAIQGLVEVAAGPKWSRASALVDGAHSLTAAGLGVGAARWRRAALIDSVVAAAFACAGWARCEPAGLRRGNEFPHRRGGTAWKTTGSRRRIGMS
jgi:hypothetical protein